MGNRKNNDWKPGFPRITRIELPEGHIRLRAVLAIILFALGIGAIVYGVSRFLSTEPGWQLVEADVSGPSFQEEIQFMYDFSDLGGSATGAYRSVAQLYSDAMERAYQAFGGEETSQISLLNRSVNETVTVDEVLYHALEQVVESGSRTIYLAPAYQEYQRILRSESDAEAESYDPAFNQEQAAYVAEVAAFAGDETQISLELMEDNQVCLRLSEECLRFSEENGIDSWVDFSWMRNAFVVDYLADTMADAGFTHGYLASYDGFTRNLDDRGMSYSYNLFDRQGNFIDLPAVLEYGEPISIVFLRSYSMSERDNWHYYTYQTGETVSLMLRPTDGLNRVAAENLVCYAAGKGCAEILLAMLPEYLTDSLSQDGLARLEGQGIWSVWPDGGSLCYNNPDSVLRPQEGWEPPRLTALS